MEALDELRRLVPPPAGERREPVRWARAEAELGLSLPADYKALIEEYGAGSFDDFLWVFEPGYENRYVDLLWQKEATLRALRYLADRGEEHPFAPRTEPGGLLPWGLTDNGDSCYWHLGTTDPEGWTVTINESRGPKWYRFGGSLTEFLVAYLTGRERVSVFPEDGPGHDLGFTPGSVPTE